MARRRMPLYSDNLVQGVSQQIAPKRTLNHWEDALNIQPSIITGNTKRSSFKVRGLLPDPLSADDAFHFYTRDAQERYMVVVSGGGITVINRNTGEEVPVAAPGGTSYLTSVGSSFSAFDFLTLGDTTLIANRERVVAMTADVTPALPNVAILYVRRGDYNLNYKVFIDGVERAEFKTGDGTGSGGGLIGSAPGTWEANDPIRSGTDFIAKALEVALAASLGAGWTITRSGSVVRITKVDGSAFTIKAEDGMGGEGISAVLGSIQRFEKLPDRAPNGYTVKVSGDQGKKLDDFYVKFTALDAASIDSEGVWEETIGPSTPYHIDPATMPHVLKRLPDGTFEFGPQTWDDRRVGDVNSVPNASFIGKKINGMFFHQNRLGFLSEGNHISSVTTDYFNFWRQSARTALDTDPVDAAVTISRAISLRYAFPYNRQLIIFADDAQIVVQGGQTFAYNNVSSTVASEYRMDPQNRPVAVGKSIFFTSARGEVDVVTGKSKNNAVMELRTPDDGSAQAYAVEVSEHVPFLIPGGAVRMTASSTEKGLIIIPLDSPTGYFGYHWMFAGQDRVISSWAPYALADGGDSPTSVIAAYFEDSNLELVTNRTGNPTVYGVMSLSETGRWLGTLDGAHMDFTVSEAECTVTYDGVEDITTITAPIRWGEPTILVASDVVGVIDLEDEILDVVDGAGSSTIFTVRGDFTGTEMRIGEDIRFSLTFTSPYAPAYGPRGEILPDQSARVQIGKGTLSYTDSGPFSVVVDKPTRPQKRHEFSGLRLGSVPPVVGAPPITSGAYKFPVNGDTEEVQITVLGKSWMPFNITAAKWDCTKMRSVGR